MHSLQCYLNVVHVFAFPGVIKGSRQNVQRAGNFVSDFEILLPVQDTKQRAKKISRIMFDIHRGNHKQMQTLRSAWCNLQQKSL